MMETAGVLVVWAGVFFLLGLLLGALLWRKYRVLQHEFLDERESLKTRNATLEKRISELEEKGSALSEKKESEQAAESAAVKEVAKLKLHIQSLERDLSAKNEQIHSHLDMIEDREQELAEMAKDLADLRCGTGATAGEKTRTPVPRPARSVRRATPGGRPETAPRSDKRPAGEPEEETATIPLNRKLKLKRGVAPAPRPEVSEVPGDVEQSSGEAPARSDSDGKTSAEPNGMMTDTKLGLVFREAPKSADDLTKIKGIGETTQKRLNSLGIYTYRQIADWKPDVVLEIASRLDVSDQIENQDWKGQAKKIANKGQ